MLSILILHIVITVICSLAGLLFYLLVPGNVQPGRRSLLFYPVTGLIIITLVSQVGVLFFPVNQVLSGAVVLALTVAAFLKRAKVVSFYRDAFARLSNLPAYMIALFAVFWIVIIILNSGPTMMDDTDSYHIQMIKWSNEYGSVPGIVNLHYRYGFNSSWFTSISFFLPSPTTRNFFTTLNGVISFWFCAYLLYRLFQSSPQEKNVATRIGILIVLVLALFCFPMVRGNGSTANYDFITTLLVVVLFVETTRKGRSAVMTGFTAELVLWPVYLFTVRIINYPLLILSLYGLYLLIKNREWRGTIIYAGLSSILLAAFIARNVLLSGYPFYPSVAFDLFQVDWKPDDELVKWLRNYIKYYNRVNEGIMPIEQTEKLGFPSWIFEWFRHMAYYDKPVFLAGMGGLLLNIFFIKKAWRIYSTAIKIFILVIAAQLLSWFFIAPDPRFVYGCLLCSALLLPVIIFGDKAVPVFNRTVPVIGFTLMAGALTYGVVKTSKNQAYQNLLLPVQLPVPPVQEVAVDNISFKIPGIILQNWNSRCYASELPCLYILDPRLRNRGKSIRDGFRLDK